MNLPVFLKSSNKRCIHDATIKNHLISYLTNLGPGFSNSRRRGQGKNKFHYCNYQLQKYRGEAIFFAAVDIGSDLGIADLMWDKAKRDAKPISLERTEGQRLENALKTATLNP